MEEREVAHARLDLGLRDGEAGRFGVPQRALVESLGGAEVVLERAQEGEAVVRLRQLELVADGDETLARGELKLLGLLVTPAPDVQVADVLLDLAGHQGVAVREEDGARGEARFGGLFVAPEEGEGVEAADLGRGGGVCHAERAKARAGVGESRDGAVREPGSAYFAGSCLTAPEGVRNAAAWLGVSREEARELVVEAEMRALIEASACSCLRARPAE